MARKRGTSYKDKIKKMSLGLFNTVTDVCLFTIFFHLQSFQMAKGRDIVEAINKAVHLTRITNANNLSRLIYRLQSKGYLEKKQDYVSITQLAKDRLARSLPKYDKYRPWEGKLYLITYDIPEDKKRERDLLRNYLKTIGCGMLQQSVWLTPYNPKGIVIDFVREKMLAGLVLVSELREGSGIGGKDILTVIEKVYHLDKLNEQYDQFIQAVENKKLAGSQLTMTYLSVLEQDPQLPFELLPDYWLGDQAYRIFHKNLS